jgi:haloalkane dehalogenase
VVAVLPSGVMLAGAQRDFCPHWPDQNEITVPGMQFSQEDFLRQIGETIAAWLDGLA